MSGWAGRTQESSPTHPGAPRFNASDLRQAIRGRGERANQSQQAPLLIAFGRGLGFDPFISTAARMGRSVARLPPVGWASTASGRRRVRPTPLLLVASIRQTAALQMTSRLALRRAPRAVWHATPPEGGAGWTSPAGARYKGTQGSWHRAGFDTHAFARGLLRHISDTPGQPKIILTRPYLRPLTSFQAGSKLAV